MNENHLIAQYRSLAYAISRDYYFAGADRDDVKQEALIGLLVAIRRYDNRGGFELFARMVIHRHLITCLIAAQRVKHKPLNEAVREAPLLLIPGGIEPGRVLEQREELSRLQRGYSTLTTSERSSLNLASNGEPWTHRPDRKSIDNAIQRARRKLREAA